MHLSHGHVGIPVCNRIRYFVLRSPVSCACRPGSVLGLLLIVRFDTQNQFLGDTHLPASFQAKTDGIARFSNHLSAEGDPRFPGVDLQNYRATKPNRISK